MGIVVTGGSSSPFGVGNFPNFNTDVGAVAPLINTELVKKSFPTMVNYLLPKGDASLFGLTAKIKEETALQIEHGFFSKIMVFPSFTLSAAAVADTTTGGLTVLNSEQVIPQGLYKVVGTSSAGVLTPTTTYNSEIVLVTAVASATSITVVRNIGGTAFTLAASATLVHIGNAFGDASVRPNSFLTKEIRVINYTQIFRNAWAISGTVAAIQNLIGDTNLAKSRIECSQYHAMDIEKSLFFGIRANTTIGAGNTRTMGGVVAQISDAQNTQLFLPGQLSSANIVAANSAKNGVATAGDLSIDDLENWIDACANMSYSPTDGMERVVFVGKQAHTVINRLCRLNSTYDMQNGIMEWGLRFTRINMTRVTIVLIEHPLFNTNLQWARMAVAIDLNAMALAYMVGRKTKSEEYNQNGLAVDNGIDAQGGSLLSELTILCKNPSGCGIMTNIQKALSADNLVEH